jgi:hypothetical protein
MADDSARWASRRTLGQFIGGVSAYELRARSINFEHVVVAFLERVGLLVTFDGGGRTTIITEVSPVKSPDPTPSSRACPTPLRVGLQRHRLAKT